VTPRRAVLIAGLSVGLVGTWVSVTRRSGPGATDRPPTSYPPAAVIPNDPILARIARKTEVADALLRGELTLTEAAARFREVNGSDPVALAELRRTHPGAGDDELTYRQVIHFAYAGPRWPAARWVPRLRQLEAEFHATFPAAAPIPDWARTGGPGPGQPPMVRTLPVPVRGVRQAPRGIATVHAGYS
jgi:hypothetical protein